MGESVVSHCREDFAGVHGSFFVLANDRVDAFIKLFRWLTKAGNDVTVLDINRSENPLSFSSSDIAVINAAGISLKAGFPRSGFQIEDIVLA
jgi:hypothetical protein